MSVGSAYVHLRRRVVLIAAVLALGLAGATAGVAGALGFGSAAINFNGTYTGFVKYTFLGANGSASQTLAGMTNPKASVSFNSLTNGNFNVTKTPNCVIATLESGSGQGGASVTARKPPFNLNGQTIRVGGKPMGPGDYLEACAFNRS